MAASLLRNAWHEREPRRRMYPVDKLPPEDVLADVKRIVTQLSRHALVHVACIWLWLSA